ncbi:MAG: hypothetical protein SFX18_09870, partial [Pirellulales bacterium]|nr:hypothetical protein [Pirellulales bacterium]
MSKMFTDLAEWLLGQTPASPRQARLLQMPFACEERELLSAPAILTSAGSAAYVENSAPIAIDPGIQVQDFSSAQLSGGTVKLTNYVPGQDLLLFTNQNGINGTFNNVTGQLKLTGSASVAHYQTALASIKYQNLSDAPGPLSRTVEFQLTDDSQTQSPPASRGISITPVPDTPITNFPTVNEDQLSTNLLVITPNPFDGPQTTHFRISNSFFGQLYLADGLTPVNNGDFLTLSQGAAGLRFLPNPNFSGTATFQIQGATGPSLAQAGGGINTAAIVVLPMADTPSVTNATTNEDTLSSGGLVITRNAADGAEVTHYQITNITNGTLFLAD